MNLSSGMKTSDFDSTAASRNGGNDPNPNQIIPPTNEAVETVLDDRPNTNNNTENIFDAESQTRARAPRDDDDSFFVPDGTSGDAPANNGNTPPSASAPKKWMSIVMNNNLATLAVVAASAMLATTLVGAIGVLKTRTGADKIQISKATATDCIERRLHDTKPHHIAVETAAAVPSLEGRKLSTCTVTIDPPDVSSNFANCVGSSSPGNSNVLQQAINDATAGDVICMNPGKYYTACQTRINKALTIRGACAGIVANSSDTFDPTSQTRTGCTAGGETVWVASNAYDDSNGGLQGIFVDVSDVTIDGISFYEETETFRRTVGVLCDAPPGNYENISVLNNYMKGNKISSDCPIGGPSGSTNFPKTITNLEYSGNFIKASHEGIWEPLGFRGLGFSAGEWATPILTDLKIVNNVIGCKEPHVSSCQTVNLYRSFVTGESSISGNNFYENTNAFCPISTNAQFFDTDKGGVIPDGWDNVNAGVCPKYSAAPSMSPYPSVSVSPSKSAAPSVSAAPSKSGKEPKPKSPKPKSGKCTGRVRK